MWITGSVKVTQGDELALSTVQPAATSTWPSVTTSARQLQGAAGWRATGRRRARDPYQEKSTGGELGTQGIPLTLRGLWARTLPTTGGTAEQEHPDAPLKAGNCLVQVSGYNADVEVKARTCSGHRSVLGDHHHLPGHHLHKPDAGTSGANDHRLERQHVVLVNSQRLAAASGATDESDVID